jgi:ribosomal protein L30/L7E
MVPKMEQSTQRLSQNSKALADRRRRRRHRRRHSQLRVYNGDLLLQQTRSKIGATESQLATIETLGLGKIGRCAVVPSREASVISQVHAVRHLVALAPLTRAASDRLEVPVDLTKRVDVNPYSHSSRRGVRVDCEGGEWLTAESGTGGTWSRWTTGLPIGTVLGILGQEGWDRAVAYDQTAVSNRALTVPQLFDAAFAKRRLQRFARLEGQGGSASVVTPVYPRHVMDEVVLGTVEMNGAGLTWPTIRDLILATATPTLTVAISLAEDELRSIVGGPEVGSRGL